MALKILYTRVQGSLTANISAAATLLPVDATTLAVLTAQVNFAGGDWTYLTLTNGIYSEEVKVTGLSTTNLVVTRACSGSTAQIFAASNTSLYDHVGADAIKDIIAANPSPSSVTVGGAGIVAVTQPTTGNYVVNVSTPTFNGDNGVAVTGNWPNYTISYEGSGDGCGCGGGSSSGGGVDTLVLESSILTGNITGDTLTLNLPAPTFTGTGGVTVSGSWATGFTIAGAGAGGTGTVQSVSVGAGLTLAGTPTVNPTISLSNTGVTPGTFGGITVNAQGQITNIASGFAPVYGITMSNGGTVTEVANVANITLNVAAVGVQGIVELADSSSPFNANEDTMAVTSKVVSQAISALSATLLGGTQTAGESASSYTNAVASTAMSLNLSSSQKCLLIGEIQVIDSGGSTVPSYGVCIIATDATVYFSSRITQQGKQTFVALLSGVTVSSKTIGISTTALSGTQSVATATLAAIIV